MKNKNDEWIGILNTVTQKEKKRDSRIGEFSFTDPKSYTGMPYQAADLFAFVNRQQRETTYEALSPQKSRLLDFIISRHAFHKDNPRSIYAKYTDAEWENLISILRAGKKLKDARDVARGLEKQQYYPFVDNKLLKMHMATWVAKYPRHLFNK